MILIQIPTDVPNPDNNTPINLNSMFEVLLYIVTPVILILVYFYLRRKAKNSKDEKGNKE